MTARGLAQPSVILKACILSGTTSAKGDNLPLCCIRQVTRPPYYDLFISLYHLSYLFSNLRVILIRMAKSAESELHYARKNLFRATLCMEKFISLFADESYSG